MLVIVLYSKIAKQDFRSMDERMDPFFLSSLVETDKV